MYVNNPLNVDFDHLPFYGDKSSITGRIIYCVNDDIVEMLNNGSIIDVYTNQIQEE